MVYQYKSTSKLATGIRQPKEIKWANEEQRLLFEYPAAPLCASGGFGSGKTAGMVMKIHYLSSIFPGMRWVIGRRRLTDLRISTMNTFFKWCPKEAWEFGGRRSDSDKVLRYNNGSEILWVYLDDPDQANFIKGVEINGFLLDQAEEIEEEIFERLSGRLGRWDGATISPEILRWWEVETCGQPWPYQNPLTGALEVPSYALLTCNPDAETHWLYRRFHPESQEHWELRGTPEEPQPSFRDQGYRMLFMDSEKNQHLSRDNLRTMLSNDASFVRRYVRGQWGIPEGQIHDIHRTSVIDGTPELLQHLLNTCTLMRVLDHGDSAPTCCTWWAIDQQGNMFCYREYYQPNKLISYHRQAITELSRGESYTYNIADPQIFSKTMQKHGDRWAVSEEYSDSAHDPYTAADALHWTKGDNDELGIRNRINEMLKWDPNRIHPITKEKGAARMFFLARSDAYPQGCYHAVRETRSQRREQIGTDLGKPIFSDERDKKIKDHSYDTVRYAVGVIAPAATQSSVASAPNSFNNVRSRAIASIRRQGALRMSLAARLRRLG